MPLALPPEPWEPSSVSRGRLTLSLIAAARQLTTRDYTLVALLVDHRVLTTDQITAILFSARHTSLQRLTALRRLGLVERFRPPRAPTGAPWHWLAGPLAAQYVALARDVHPPTARMLDRRQRATMLSPQLAHTVGANQFFVDLIAHARTDSSARLTRWWPSVMTSAVYGQRIHPDGHGVWRCAGREIGWFLEHDTGSENHTRLIGKLAAYRRLSADPGCDYPILFWLPSQRREANLHRRLTAAACRGLTVATAARDALAGSRPADPVWRLAGSGHHRYALAELPGSLGVAGPYAPSPSVAESDPRQLVTEWLSGRR
jgi:hypothetical protein